MIIAEDIAVLTPTMPSRIDMLNKCVRMIADQTMRPYTHLIRMNYDGAYGAVNGNRMIRDALADPKINWLAWCFDDDFFYPNHVAALNRVKQDADIVYTWYRKVTPGVEDVFVRNRHEPNTLKNITNYITCPMIHRRVFEKEGLFQEENLGADWDFYKMLLDKGYRFRCTEEVTFDYIDHDSNVHNLGLKYYR